jgi:hypothetical protein
MSNVTQFEHYMRYPMCGYCNSAWDVIYQRLRMHTSPEQWLGYCPVGGCDPDIWDYIDERTGWPLKWKMQPNGFRPRWDKLPPIPDYDDRCYHKRGGDGPSEPWRKVSAKLLRIAQERSAAKRGISVEELEWDDDEEPTPEPAPEVTDADDDIEWDDDDIEWG